MGLWPDAVPFPLADGTGSPALDEIVAGPAAALTAVALVVGPRARASGWAARAAVALATRWRGPRRVLLADLDLERPVLHVAAGVQNDEGVIDMVDYGISPGRLIRPAGGGAFDLIPAGIFTPDPAGILRHENWVRVLLEVAARRGTLLAFVPVEAEGVEAVIERTGAVLVLAEDDEGRSVVEQLEHPYAVLAILTPEPAAAPEPEPESAAAPAVTAASEPAAERPAEVPAKEAAVASTAELPTAPAAELPTAPVAELPTARAAELPTAPAADLPAAPAPESPRAAEPAMEEATEAAVVERVAGLSPAAGGVHDVEPSDGARDNEPSAGAHDIGRSGVARDVEPSGAPRPTVPSGLTAPPEPEPPVPPAAGTGTLEPGTGVVERSAAGAPPEAEAEAEAEPVAPNEVEREVRERQRAARLAGAPAIPAAAEAAAGEAAAEAAAGESAAAVEAADAVASGTGAAPAAGPVAIQPRPPIPGPVVSPMPTARRRRFARPILWTVGVVLLASVLAGAWHFLGGLLPSRAAEQPQPEPVAPPPPAPVTAEQDALPYVVAIEAHRELPTALQRVADLTEIEPALRFHVESIERDGVLFYQVMAGPVADSTAALALRDTLIARGHKTGATPTDIRLAPLAFLIGDYSSDTTAYEQREILRRLDIPGYVLQAQAADGQPLYRLYVGGFSSEGEAAVTRQLLRAAGILDSLVVRTGSVPPTEPTLPTDSLVTPTGQQ